MWKNQDLKLHIQHDSNFVNVHIEKRLEGNPPNVIVLVRLWTFGFVLNIILLSHIF